LEKLVMGRLNHFLETTEQVPPQQCGFTAGSSATDAVKSGTEFVRRSRQLGSKCCLLALDIEAAFENA
jgi:hypothetical protein